MSSLGLCPNCDEGHLEDESLGGETTKTCTTCGYTLENTVLQAPCLVEGYSSSTATSFRKKYKITLDKEVCPKAQRDILQNMKLYLEKYPSCNDLYDSAAEMFLLAVKRKRNFSRIPYKRAMAASCLVLVLRKAGIHVLTTKVCREMEVDGKKLMQAMTDVRETDKSEGGIVEIEFVVDNLLQNFSDLKFNKPLRDCTVKLCKLFDDVHLSYSRETMVTIALYFALISAEPIQRVPMKIGQFCSKYSVAQRKSFQRILSQTRTKIYLLSKRLPWAPSTLTKNNCHFYIHDILKMRHVLIEKDWNCDDDTAQKCKNDKLDGDTGLSLCTSSHNVIITEQMRLEMPRCAIQNLNKAPPLPEEPDPLFVSTSEIIGEDEMKEDELQEYIRTPKEVEVVAKIHKLMEIEK